MISMNKNAYIESHVYLFFFIYSSSYKISGRPLVLHPSIKLSKYHARFAWNRLFDNWLLSLQFCDWSYNKVWVFYEMINQYSILLLHTTRPSSWFNDVMRQIKFFFSNAHQIYPWTSLFWLPRFFYKSFLPCPALINSSQILSCSSSILYFLN